MIAALLALNTESTRPSTTTVVPTSAELATKASEPAEEKEKIEEEGKAEMALPTGDSTNVVNS